MQNTTASPRLVVAALCAGLGLAALAAPAAAQTIGYNVRTGDVWVDNRLGEIDQYGRQYRDPFIGEMTGHYGAPRSLVMDLLDRRGWAPADVWYACAIAQAVRMPCIDVVNRYDRNPGQGWGALAQQLGIKPGSPAFHALKRGTVSTYDRWGYPIAIDRDVRVDWSQPRDRNVRRDSPGRNGPPAHAGRAGADGPAKGRPAHAGGPGRGHDAGGPPAGKGGGSKGPQGKAPEGNKGGGGGGRGGGGKGQGQGNGNGNGKGRGG